LFKCFLVQSKCDILILLISLEFYFPLHLCFLCMCMCNAYFILMSGGENQRFRVWLFHEHHHNSILQNLRSKFVIVSICSKLGFYLLCSINLYQYASTLQPCGNFHVGLGFLAWCVVWWWWYLKNQRSSLCCYFDSHIQLQVLGFRFWAIL
jgi:hypothetical protein